MARQFSSKDAKRLIVKHRELLSDMLVASTFDIKYKEFE